MWLGWCKDRQKLVALESCVKNGRPKSDSWACIGWSELERKGRERDRLEMDNRSSLNSSTSPTAPQRAGNWRQRRLPNLEGGHAKSRGSVDGNTGAHWSIGALGRGGTLQLRRGGGSQMAALPSDLQEFALPLRPRTGIPLSTQRRARGRGRAHSRSISGLVNGRGRLGQPSSNERHPCAALIW